MITVPIIYGKGYKREIWAWGFRNPWRWTFDPLNGDLWVADVGQNTTEEVDIVAKGANYGWPNMEGPDQYIGPKDNSMVLPVFSYTHDKGSCIIGAAVYRGNPASKYYGNLFVTDESARTVYALKKNGSGLATSQIVGTLPAKPATLNQDFESRIFVGIEDDGQPVYTLDSPDLAPAATSVFSEDVRRKFAHTIFVSLGSALPLSYFTGQAKATLFDMQGIKAATLTGLNPTLPKAIKSGLYVVAIAGSGGKPDLLIVR